eukprot:scaffold137776_cov28-Tisochrysis_lutea.AAC.3
MERAPTASPFPTHRSHVAPQRPLAQLGRAPSRRSQSARRLPPRPTRTSTWLPRPLLPTGHKRSHVPLRTTRARARAQLRPSPSPYLPSYRQPKSRRLSMQGGSANSQHQPPPPPMAIGGHVHILYMLVRHSQAARATQTTTTH